MCFLDPQETATLLGNPYYRDSFEIETDSTRRVAASLADTRAVEDGTRPVGRFESGLIVEL